VELDGSPSAPPNFTENDNRKSAKMKVIRHEDFEALATALSGTFVGTKENRETLESLLPAFMKLEEGCTVMFETIMKHKSKLDELERRLSELEKLNSLKGEQQ